MTWHCSPVPCFASILSILVFALLATSLLRAWMRWRTMPPGPTGIPILGNIFQMPQSTPWIRFTEWGHRYGPVYSLNVAGHPIIILNSLRVATDMLERRSNIYSDRPRFVMAGEILTGGIFMVFARYGRTWRKMRRASHEGFNARATQEYHPALAAAAAQAVIDISHDSVSWRIHLARTTASGILTAVYGWPPITQENIKLMNRIHAHTARIASAVVPGAFLVDVLPFLKYVPKSLAKWKREGLEWHSRESEMFEELNGGVSQMISAGQSVDCFVTSLIQNEGRHGLSKKEAAWLAGIMFSAGAETTSASLFNFVLAMVLYPEVMYKAQMELDTVVGRERLPSFSDKDQLPYIRSIVREVLRWRPVGPLAVPRRATKDDWYEGYFIPKGATIIPNIWAINRDPAVFPDYEEFRPERFLNGVNDDDFAHSETHATGHATFGLGRRMCVGASFASATLFIDIATILWAYNIEKVFDVHGNAISPSRTAVIDAGVVVAPAPFECRFAVRSRDVIPIIERAINTEVRR